jgi:hypothetical protein
MLCIVLDPTEFQCSIVLRGMEMSPVLAMYDSEVKESVNLQYRSTNTQSALLQNKCPRHFLGLHHLTNFAFWC